MPLQPQITEECEKLYNLYTKFTEISEEASENDANKREQLIKYATQIKEQVDILKKMGSEEKANDILFRDLEDQTINQYLGDLKEETVQVNSKKVRFGIFQIAAVLLALTLPLTTVITDDTVESKQLADYVASYEQSMSDIVDENKKIDEYRQHPFAEYENEIAETYAKTKSLVDDFSKSSSVPAGWMEALKGNMEEMGKEVALFNMGTGMVPYEEKDTGLYADNIEGTGLVSTSNYNNVDMSEQVFPYNTKNINNDLERFKMVDRTLDNQTGPTLDSYGNDSIKEYGGRRSRRKIRRSHKRRSCKKRKSRRKRGSSSRRKRGSSSRRKSRVSRK